MESFQIAGIKSTLSEPLAPAVQKVEKCYSLDKSLTSLKFTHWIVNIHWIDKIINAFLCLNNWGKVSKDELRKLYY